MSFSTKVKEELGRRIPVARHCCIAEFAALFLQCGSFIKSDNGMVSIMLHTENLTVARKSYILISMAFDYMAEVCVRNGKEFYVIVTNTSVAVMILKALKIVDESESHWGDFQIVPNRLITGTCCKRAYVRGVFMTSGSISNPEKGYHLEIAFDLREQCEQLMEIVKSFDIEAKAVMRKSSYVFYIKESSTVALFLNIIEAHQAMMDFENIRIVKELRNSVNRQVNCETANISKTVNAAKKQLEDIRYIELHGGIKKLSDNLREMAELRLEFPEASLQELGGMLSKPLGKSGVNHRLRKIGEYADLLREQTGDLQ